MVSLSRRFLLLAAGSSAVGLALPGRGHAQEPEAAPDGFRTVEARPAGIGPTLHARRGDEVRVRLINRTEEPTALHWRGVRIANAMDGVPGLTQAAIEPGASFDYRFTVPDAGTFWYGPPVWPGGRPMTGPSGALLVAESEPGGVDRDVLLMVRQQSDPPVVDIPIRSHERLRLRLVNAAQSRMLAARIDRHPAWVMAVDSQPAEPFLARDSRVVLAPGNRADLVIDGVLGPGETAAISMASATGETALARLVYGDAPMRPQALPDPRALPANPLPLRMNFSAAQRIEAVFPGLEVLPQPPAKPLFGAARGRTVVIALNNRSEQPAVAHIHGHSFRLLDRLDDGWKPFWLDTTIVPPRETVRIAFVADNPGKWRLEFREIERSNKALLNWFEVK